LRSLNCRPGCLPRRYEEGANLSEVDTLLQCARELGGLGMEEAEVSRPPGQGWDCQGKTRCECEGGMSPP